MSERKIPSWINFVIRHIENDPEYQFDGLDIEIEMEVRDAGDEGGNTSEYQSWFVATNGYRIQYHGEGWCWERDSPHTITWRNLRRELKQAVLLDCLEGLEHLRPIEIWFDNEVSEGNLEFINPAKYGVDVTKYLYKGKW